MSSTTIPRTAMVARYLATKGGSGVALFERAAEVERDPSGLVEDFLASASAFASYDNRAQAFHPHREPPQLTDLPPHGRNVLWRTNDISGRLHPAGHLAVKPADAQDFDLGATYVGRELQVARTTGANSHVCQRRADPALNLLTLDLLMVSDDAQLPVLGEVKTPSDVTAYHALIQVLAAASQLATSAQAERLRLSYPDAEFPGEADPRVDAVIYSVDPERCGVPDVGKKPSPKVPELNAIAEPIARKFMAAKDVGRYVRRLSLVRLGLHSCRLEAEAAWSFESIRP